MKTAGRMGLGCGLQLASYCFRTWFSRWGLLISSFPLIWDLLRMRILQKVSESETLGNGVQPTMFLKVLLMILSIVKFENHY